MKRVYVCSPFAGDTSANLLRAESLCRAVALRGDAPLVPHLYLPRALRDEVAEERRLGMAIGLAWLAVCDELLVSGPVSSGMLREIEAAAGLGIPVVVEDGPR